MPSVAVGVSTEPDAEDQVTGSRRSKAGLRFRRPWVGSGGGRAEASEEQEQAGAWPRAMRNSAGAVAARPTSNRWGPISVKWLKFTSAITSSSPNTPFQFQSTSVEPPAG